MLVEMVIVAQRGR